MSALRDYYCAFFAPSVDEPEKVDAKRIEFDEKTGTYGFLVKAGLYQEAEQLAYDAVENTLCDIVSVENTFESGAYWTNVIKG